RPQGVRVPVRATGDGAAVLRTARGAGRTPGRTAPRLRADTEGPAIPPRCREDGRRGAARRRRGDPGAVGENLCLAEGDHRPGKGGGGMTMKGWCCDSRAA